MNNLEKGLKVENEIINYINEKEYIYKMNRNMQRFIKEIFNFNLTNIKLQAYKYAKNCKPDIVIKANNVEKYISIKSGKNNSVHQEHLYSFIFFLLDNRKDFKNLVEVLRLFHFNDMTLDGKGIQRKNANDFYNNYPKAINSLNNFFNSKDNIELILKRILFDGEYFHTKSADYIYYGNVSKGIWASKNDILKYLKENTSLTNNIHISKIFYQNLNRNLTKKDENEYKRYKCQFKWHSLVKDISFIMRNKKQ